MTKIYVASGLENVDAVRLLQRKLRDMGCTITYDWTTHGSVQDAGADRIRLVALEEAYRGVQPADLVIVLLPGGQGTHVELGLALAWHKPVFLVGDPFQGRDRECSFYYLTTQRFKDDIAVLHHMAKIMAA